MLAALALALAFQQDTSVVDVPVYESATLGVSLPRPFDDWVFSPATARGTTTVIFQPRSGSLSDQLWGALVVSSWGRAVPLGAVADRRITTTWRSMLGRSFRLLARDSVDLAGLPAIHIVMTGSIDLAALDIEEYLVARGSELIALQFRYPRGQPRDSISAGYLRSLEGLRIRSPGAAPRAVARAAMAPTWDLAIEHGLVFFDLPQDFQAIAPGRLSSELTAQGRRLMRWSPLIGGPDTSLYAVGRFRPETRRVGRLTVRIWRNLSTDTTLTRVTDDMIATLAQAWSVYWRDFGALPTAEISVIETTWRETRGAAAAVFAGADLRPTATAPAILRRELSRSWWGGLVRPDGAASYLITELLPTWSASLAARNALIGEPAGPVAALDTLASSPAGAVARARRIAGDAVFREAIQTLVLESRGGPPALTRFFAILGDRAAAELRSGVREQNR